MKAFLEEYGFVILIAIVIILLIVMATPVGNSIKASVLSLVDRFSGTATSKLDKADQGDFTAAIRQASANDAYVYLDLNSDSTTDQYSYTVTYVSGGKTKTTSELVKGKTGSGSDITYTYFGNGETIKVVGQNNKAVGGDEIDDGSTIYVTVTNVGTNEKVQSNSIKFHRLSVASPASDATGVAK